MEKLFEQNFTVHPVGQGLFYSCHIRSQLNSREAKFDFIFDCGSMTHANGREEAEIFHANYLEGTRLELLVISHFDADHVNKLKFVLGNCKIDNIVLPFTLFEERLFLALRYIQYTSGYSGEDDDFTLGMIIDPLGTLGKNFDEGTNVFLMTGGNDTPPSSGEGKAPEDIPMDNEGPAMGFDFDGLKEDLTDADAASFGLVLPEKVTVKKIDHSVKGMIHLEERKDIHLMDFIFYHKSPGEKEQEFYQTVFRLFCGQFNIDIESGTASILAGITQALKTIKGATVIKNLFKRAAEKMGGIEISISKLRNMNTTALCLLHRNRDEILSVFSSRDGSPYDVFFDIAVIQKFDGTDDTRVEQHSFKSGLYNMRQYFIPRRPRLNLPFWPNTLLSSDCYLLSAGDVEAFYKHYTEWWTNFWLFQVSHHGSKNNSDKHLFSRLPQQICSFINYGTRHQFDRSYQHPDGDLVREMISAGQGGNVEAVNEFKGLCFRFSCYG